MTPSISSSFPAITPDASTHHEGRLSPYDCRSGANSGAGQRMSLYPVHDPSTHPQAASKRLSEPIVTTPTHPSSRFPSNGAAGCNSHSTSTQTASNLTDWVFQHSNYTYQSVETVSLKQAEYDHSPVDVQGLRLQQLGSFTDVGSSINNTRAFHHLEGHHHMNPTYVTPQYCTQVPPPPYTEGVRGGSWGYDMEPYYGQQAASTQYPMDLSSPDQINFDSQPLVSNNLHHHVHGYSSDHHQQPSQLNQAHVSSNGGSFDLTSSTTVAGVVGGGTSQPQVDMTAAPPPSSSSSTSSPSTSSFRHQHHSATDSSVPRVYDHDGCMDIPQLAVHSEQPPLSSYSELSAHMKYYSHMTLARQPSKLTSIGQLQLQPLPPPVFTMPGPGSIWTGSSVVTPSGSGDNTPTTAPPPTRSPSSSIPLTTATSQDFSTASSLPFEPWTPSAPQHKSVKSESIDHPLSALSLSVSKRHPSSDLTSNSGSLGRRGTPPSPASDTSRRSRTLSPNSRTQGALKTIMVKRGTSEPKKQNLACLFCRERKIACGRPAEGSMDPTCNQCARRSLTCQYPTESRRGQHKRSKKNQPDHHGHNVNRAK